MLREDENKWGKETDATVENKWAGSVWGVVMRGLEYKKRVR